MKDSKGSPYLSAIIAENVQDCKGRDKESTVKKGVETDRKGENEGVE